MKAWPALLAGLGAFILYARTLAPGLTWAHSGADGGDLLAAALTQGVAHPTGYPTYQILLRAAIYALDLAGVEPARAGAWFSALCIALAAALVADLARRVLSMHTNAASWRASASATIAALAFAAAPAVWGQATITEVYALNGLVCAALLWLSWRWAEARAATGQSTAWLAIIGLAFGLGLGNHVIIVLMLPGLAAWFFYQSRTLAGARANLRGLAWASILFLAGLSVYAYLPLAAAGRPPVNWGDPVTVDRFLWTVSGRLYAPLAFGLPIAELPARLAGWLAEAMRQFGGPWGLLLALAGLWQLDRLNHAWWRTTALVALAFTIYAIGYNTADSFVYLIPAWAVASLWLAEGIAWGLGAVDKPARIKYRAAVIVVLLAVLLAVLPGFSVWQHWPTHDLSQDRVAVDFVADALQAAEPNAVILTAGDQTTFALWYAVYGLRQRPDMTPLNVNLYGFNWYARTFAETHPDVLPWRGESRPAIGMLVSALIDERPVYRADDVTLALPGVVEEQAGVLVHLQRRP